MSANAKKIVQQDLEFQRACELQRAGSEESSHELLAEKKRSVHVVNTSLSLTAKAAFTAKAALTGEAGSTKASVESKREQESASEELRKDEELRTDEELRADIAQILKLVANTLDAHSVFLLLPSLVGRSEMMGSLVSRKSSASAEHSQTQEYSHLEGLTPFASQTLSPKALPKKQAPVHAGPLLWVAKTGKPLHISPFEMDATGLGVYGMTVPLKSLAAVPISCEHIAPKIRRLAENDSTITPNSLLTRGVLVVDSLKAYKFTPLQVKLLQQLGTQIERTLELHADRFNLLRERRPLSNEQDLLNEQEYCHEKSLEKLEVSGTRTGSKPQTGSEKFRSQIESLLQEEHIKTMSIASISLTETFLTVSSLDVPESQDSVTVLQASEKLDTNSSAPTQSRRLLTHHFPVERLLTLPQQIHEVWRSSVRDFHEFLESEQTTSRAEGSALLSTPSESRVASLVTGQKIILVCDHLRVAMLTKKIRGLFLFHLRKKLQFVIEDPREATFEAIAQELLTAHIAPLKSLTEPNNTLGLREYGCIGKWLQYTLSEGTTLRSSIPQNSKPPIRKWGWLRSDFTTPWKGSSKTPENLTREGKRIALFERSSFSLGKTTQADNTSIQTLRGQFSRDQNQPLHQRRAS